MKKIKECLPFILALIIFFTIKLNAQVPCTFTTCSPFGNNDMRQLYGAVVSTGSNQTTANATLTIIKQKHDTIAQSHRSLNALNTAQNATLTNIFNRLDTIIRSINVTFTWTSPPTFTPVVGNWATNSTSAVNLFSIALPQGTWRITNLNVINGLFMPLNIYVFNQNFQMGPNNTITNASITNMSRCVGVFDGITSSSALNGYVGYYPSNQFVKTVVVRNTLFFACSYRATTVNNNVAYYINFTLER